MDLLALALLWTVIVVPVGISAVLRRRHDSIAAFERARETLQPGGRTAAQHRAQRNHRRRRTVVMLLVTFALTAAVVAAFSRTRVALGLGLLAIDMCIAYAAAIAAVDRRQLRRATPAGQPLLRDMPAR